MVRSPPGADIMDIQILNENLSHSLNNSFKLEQKRNNLYQIFVPLFYNDGDMLDIYLKPDIAHNSVVVCDCGKTLMRLSYKIDIDTPRIEKVVTDIAHDNDALIDNGNIYIQSSLELLFENIMQLSRIISQIDTIPNSRHNTIRSVFYDDIDNYIINNLSTFKPQKNVLPIKDRDDLVVDYTLTNNNKPFYIFGILGNNKALSTVISILSFQQEKIPFTSIAIHSNYQNLTKSTQKKIMNATDKQFFDLDSFCSNVQNYLERNAS